MTIPEILTAILIASYSILVWTQFMDLWYTNIRGTKNVSELSSVSSQFDSRVRKTLDSIQEDKTIDSANHRKVSFFTAINAEFPSLASSSDTPICVPISNSWSDSLTSGNKNEAWWRNPVGTVWKTNQTWDKDNNWGKFLSSLCYSNVRDFWDSSISADPQTSPVAYSIYSYSIVNPKKMEYQVKKWFLRF